MTKLVDGFGRRIEYLRLSVTDRCDLRCSYCMPADHRDFSEPDHWLTFDETEQVVRVALLAGSGASRGPRLQLILAYGRVLQLQLALAGVMV